MSEKTEIFYFSGTGNSYQVACNIAEKIAHCSLKSICEYDNKPVTSARVGVVFPVYMWGLPNIVRRFFEQIDINKGKYIFAVATYGGFPGKALEQAESILRDRGLELYGGYNIHMPGNYIMGYGAFSDRKQKKLCENAKLKSYKIAQAVGYMKKNKTEKSKFVIDRIFADKMYAGMGNINEEDKNYHVNEHCTGCGKCAALCPVSNIILENGHPQWQHHCELCVACIQRCPMQAIEYKNKTHNRKRYVNQIYKQRTE